MKREAAFVLVLTLIFLVFVVFNVFTKNTAKSSVEATPKVNTEVTTEAVTAQEDVARIERVEDGEILAEVWIEDRYFYVIEFYKTEEISDQMAIVDAYQNLYYSVYTSGFTWNPEKKLLTKTFEEDWEADEYRYEAYTEEMLFGRIGGDAGTKWTISLEWAIGADITDEVAEEISSYHSSCRLISVEDGTILAGQQSDYGDWYYIVEVDGCVFITDAFLEVSAVFDDLREDEVEEIDWKVILSCFLEDDLQGLLDEFLGDVWEEREDTKWFFDDDPIQEEQEDIWEEQRHAPTFMA
ncbi:MAG: hypothetical protein IJ867_00005 [Clostridia bacterium]|nr:hypothetical protein [Clostridia bacterium]